MKLKLHLIFFLMAVVAQAATIKGKIKDEVSGDPIVGATVHLKGTNHSTFVNLDGSYALKNIQSGSYTLVVNFIGYALLEKPVSITEDKDVVVDFKMKEMVNVLNEVVITGALEKGSEGESRKIEQNSDNVVSVIGARAIQLLPDITVGNLMQRVSGVAIVRNGNGDGQYAIIRGMDQRYNYTTVNGIKIPSPDGKNRYIPMDIFPAELLERLDVVKALTPSMEGDAIGGAMNMVMKSAPNHFQVQATISGGYGSVLADHPFKTFDTKNLDFKTPFEIHGNNYISQVGDYSTNQLKLKTVNAPISSTYGLTIGNRFFKNRLGVVVAGSYQHMYRSHNGIFYVISGQPNAGNVVSFDGIENRNYSSLQSRSGVHVNLDYNLGSKTKLNFYNIFAQLDETQQRHREEIRTTDVGEYSTHERSMFQRQRINSSTFKIDQIITKNFKANLSLNSSIATNIIPDQLELDVKTRVDRNGTTGQLSEPAQYINALTHKWYHNTDKDKGAYLNLTYTVIPAIEISAGGLYKTKTKDNYYTENTLNTFGVNTTIGQPYTNVDNLVAVFNPTSNATADTTDGKNYVANEQIKAWYLQGKFIIAKKLQIVGGLRTEITSQSYTSAISVTSAGKMGAVIYKDYLPSIHFKYELTKKSNLRLSYFKGISRPALQEFILAPNVGDYYTETGNPLLLHTKSSNYDFRYEFFPSSDEQLLAGVFYKNIINPIEYSFTQILSNQYYYAPKNFGNAVNYGFELVASKFYKKFGISGNYTFTKSSITTQKRTIEANGTPGSVDVTRPLQGQSKHIANVSLIYKNSKYGIDLRLSWVYTGERINIVSAYYGLDYWQRPTSQLDFSGEKKLGKRFVIYAKATNILNSSTIVEIRSPLPAYFQDKPGQSRTDRTLVSKDIFGQNYLLGLRFKI